MDFQEIFEKAPIPIMVIQQGRIVYANSVFLDIMAWAGHPSALEDVSGSDLSLLVAPEEREASRQSIARLLASPEPVQRNISRTLIDAAGNRFDALISVSRIPWDGATALEASFVLLGPRDLTSSSLPPDPRWSHDFRRSALMSLTPRERRVAELVAAGYSTDNIGAHLGVKESTVRSHLKSIFRKTGTHSRLELTRFFIGARGTHPTPSR